MVRTLLSFSALMCQLAPVRSEGSSLSFRAALGDDEIVDRLDLRFEVHLQVEAVGEQRIDHRDELRVCELGDEPS